MSSHPQDTSFKIIAQNKKARHNYFIKETFEAGLVLMGSEVKSLRLGKANIEESYADEQGGEMFILNMNITEYAPAKHFSHTPKRPRKLLLKKRERNKLMGQIQRKGMTVVPLSLYFNHKGIVKLSLGLAEGKKLHDKRASEKQRDWNRERGRVMRDKG